MMDLSRSDKRDEWSRKKKSQDHIGHCPEELFYAGIHGSYPSTGFSPDNILTGRRKALIITRLQTLFESIRCRLHTQICIPTLPHRRVNWTRLPILQSKIALFYRILSRYSQCLLDRANDDPFNLKCSFIMSGFATKVVRSGYCLQRGYIGFSLASFVTRIDIVKMKMQKTCICRGLCRRPKWYCGVLFTGSVSQECRTLLVDDKQLQKTCSKAVPHADDPLGEPRPPLSCRR